VSASRWPEQAPAIFRFGLGEIAMSDTEKRDQIDHRDDGFMAEPKE
jgi:hypothetical protein